MGFKNMKRDDHGHVISNDEVDGQKCQHVSGRAQEVEDQKYNKEMKEAQEQNALMSESFDDDYDEEFENSFIDENEGITITDPHMDSTGRYELNYNEAVKDYGQKNIDKWRENAASNRKGWKKIDSDEGDIRIAFGNEEDDNYISFENGKEKILAHLDNNGEMEDKEFSNVKEAQEWIENNRFDEDDEFDLEDAIKNADDDVLDDYFGKDTSERKLAGAIKGNDADKGIQNQINNAVNHFKQDYFLSNNSDEDVARVAKGMGYNVKPIGERMANGAQKYQISKNTSMTKEQRQAIREQINRMVASLDDARSVDEAWDIEEGIKELEDMLKKFKGK